MEKRLDFLISQNKRERYKSKIMKKVRYGKCILMNWSMQSTITATVLGLAAQIEREFISIGSLKKL